MRRELGLIALYALIILQLMQPVEIYVYTFARVKKYKSWFCHSLFLVVIPLKVMFITSIIEIVHIYAHRSVYVNVQIFLIEVSDWQLIKLDKGK